MIRRTCLILFATGAIVACEKTVDIDVDNDVSFYHLEAGFPLEKDSHNRISFRASGASGDYDQTLEADENIRFDDKRIRGPAELEGDLDLQYFSLAYGWDGTAQLTQPGSNSTSIYVGIANPRTDLDIDRPENSLDISESTIEFYSQFGFHHLITERAKFGFTTAFSLGTEPSGFSEIDLLLTYELTRQLHVKGGYRWFRYIFETDDESDLEVDFHGPMLGLQLGL